MDEKLTKIRENHGVRKNSYYLNHEIKKKK